mmetsp:Transcript_11223/g.21002  ORF Transcript_11223/g.21002 Transcript_11223/m.21002 type:complete len:255 (-) Transcript_11223:1507-2271(-)
MTSKTFLQWKSVFPLVGTLIIFGSIIVNHESIFRWQSSSSTIFYRSYFTILFTIGMEYIARYEHKYLWHSRIFWFIHASHHHQQSKVFAGPSKNDAECNTFVSEQKMELNDIFPVIFSSIAMLVLWKCSEPSSVLHDICYGSACGISIYGSSYFLGHDLCAHERCGKGVAQWLKRKCPTMAHCAEVHSRYHHRIKKDISDEDDPYGPPYGFWLGPDEVKYNEKNGKDLGIPIAMKCCFYFGGLVTLSAFLGYSY